ncbi:DUF1573 domain-containing protein [Flavicella sp.]|uniref:DUF1573 domain-containing protein n=1 Tax=Flavicella sp. TaxID=2957742 RepID=UPI00261B5FB7|nr:DUF1573 domain-containing protein [Flavicella sp.]MDG1803779.1 DUF1573 domain-containing protein [Flavicella sp.]MDG2280986.1 DUF1573 domain-containing protein [Flavicella sp.]
MRKIILVVAIALGVVSCKESAASKVKNENVTTAKERDVAYLKLPVVSFDKASYDFGTIDEGDVIETSFEIKNIGKTDLIIKKASATCGCTIPDWPKEAIKPGESAPMKVKFNSRGKRNKISKTITLVTNTESGKETVKITGFVNPKEKK